uniref:(northern house mosquito) hypothetical protein n=1 Tax=Culex pipiens TaxID=7175 RepID=A0A8D8F8D0_CULPI
MCQNMKSHNLTLMRKTWGGKFACTRREKKTGKVGGGSLFDFSTPTGWKTGLKINKIKNHHLLKLRAGVGVVFWGEVARCAINELGLQKRCTFSLLTPFFSVDELAAGDESY